MPNTSHREDSKLTTARSDKICIGASDEPGKNRNKNYDVHEPLENPGHEALAQYLAAPKSLRKFTSDGEFAKHFQVARMTVFRWKQDADVIERAFWLSRRNQMIGDLLARQEWPRIMEAAVEKARKGDIQAIRFCEARAWAQQLRVQESTLSASVMIEDLLCNHEGDEPGESPNNDIQSEGGDR